MDGEPVRDWNELQKYLQLQTEAGQTATVTLVRDGQVLERPLVLGTQPD